MHILNGLLFLCEKNLKKMSNIELNIQPLCNISLYPRCIWQFLQLEIAIYSG